MNLNNEHDHLFEEISNKLNELGTHSAKKVLPPVVDSKTEKLELKLKKSQIEIQNYYSEIKQKQNEIDLVNRSLETTQSQINLLVAKLEEEKMHNHKLNSDMSKSLELSLKSQLELQESKAKFNLLLNEERKYSKSLEEKLSTLENDSELNKTLYEEIKIQYSKAKEKWAEESEKYKQNIKNLEENVIELQNTFLNFDEKMIKHKIFKNKLKIKFKNFQHKQNEKFKTQIAFLQMSWQKDKDNFEMIKNEYEVSLKKLMANKVQMEQFTEKLHSEIQFKNNEIQRILEENSHLINQMNLVNRDNQHTKQQADGHYKTLTTQVQQLEAHIQQIRQERMKENEQTMALMKSRDLEIQKLNQDSKRDKDLIENLMSVAESKMVELQMSLSKKQNESSQMEKVVRQYQVQNESLMIEISKLKQYILQRPS